MRLTTFKKYDQIQRARLAGPLFAHTVRHQLALLASQGIAAKIEPHLVLEEKREKGNVLLIAASYNLISSAQEKRIMEILVKLKSAEDIPAATARKIREDVIAVLYEDLLPTPVPEEPVTGDGLLGMMETAAGPVPYEQGQQTFIED